MGYYLEESPEPTRELRPRQEMSKAIVAMVLGVAGGAIIRWVLAVSLALTFYRSDSLPSDLMLLIELSSAFVGGAIAGALTLKLGWLFGLTTEVGRLVLGVILVMILQSVTLTDIITVVSSGSPVGGFIARSALLTITCAGIAGAIAHKYRFRILGLLGSLFGLLAGGLGCLAYSLAWLLELYFLYLAGREIFGDGSFLMGLAYACVIGPIASLVLAAILYGVVAGVGWAGTKLYNWYADDVGLERL